MKTVTLYRPSVLENGFHDFDRYMFGESLFAPAARSFFGRLPLVDLRESPEAYLLDVELPGFDEKNLQVHVNAGVLTIESKLEEQVQQETDQTEKAEPPKTAFLVRERRLTAFTRSFKLPENADPEQITAVFKNGVLNIEIAKRAEAQKRTIQIEKR
ncbi:MAG: Hsp20/alpha crystallin family protein [Spirochaetaceae bacterium]|jgi:HSP20 family protein|nr:Hsp20/alpha crystallin family protein [Spirochaetaceae bacterium]